jgi:hypothetical protein
MRPNSSPSCPESAFDTGLLPDLLPDCTGSAVGEILCIFLLPAANLGGWAMAGYHTHEVSE